MSGRGRWSICLCEALSLLGAAVAVGLVGGDGYTLAMLVVAVRMILTPLMVKAGAWLASRHPAQPEGETDAPPPDSARHVIVIGYDEVGQLLTLMLQRANLPHFAVERDIGIVRQAKAAGRTIYFGDMLEPTMQQAANLGKAAAVYVTSHDTDHAKALAVTLHRVYPTLDVYVRVRTPADQAELSAKGIKHAGTDYIESTLARGGMLLKDLGITEEEVDELIKGFQQDDYALIRAAYAAVEKS